MPADNDELFAFSQQTSQTRVSCAFVLLVEGTMFSAMQRTRMALRPTGARFMGMGGHSMEHAIGTSKPRPGTIWAAAAQGARRNHRFSLHG